jgi:hypothetical protein
MSSVICVEYGMGVSLSARRSFSTLIERSGARDNHFRPGAALFDLARFCELMNETLKPLTLSSSMTSGQDDLSHAGYLGPWFAVATYVAIPDGGTSRPLRQGQHDKEERL